MQRPFVNITSKGNMEELLNELHRNMDKFLAFGQVVGIILNGGLAREYADHLSEIDLIIFLTNEQYLEYRTAKTPVPIGITMIDGYLYDIKIENYDNALTRQLSMVALWDLSYAKIVYDPEHKLADLIKNKLSHPIATSQAGGLLFDAWWNFRLAGDIWIHRNDVGQGHYVLNNAIKPLISALFIANHEYIPHDKWLVHMSKTLAWKPDNWDYKLTEALSTGKFDLSSLIVRQEAIAELWSAIDYRLREQGGLEISFMQKYFYETLRFLIEKGKMSIADWEQVSNMDMLNSQPFHDVTHIDDGIIFFDVDRFIAIQPNDMYSWFYEVVDSVRADVASEELRGKNGQ